MKSGAAAAIKAATKKAITLAKNTTSNNNQKNKGTGKPNIGGGAKTAASHAMVVSLSAITTTKSGLEDVEKNKLDKIIEEMIKFRICDIISSHFYDKLP